MSKHHQLILSPSCLVSSSHQLASSAPSLNLEES